MGSEARTDRWRWWFEMAPPPADALEGLQDPIEERLFRLLLSPAGHEADFIAIAREFAAKGDADAQAAAIGGGIAGVCDGGRQFSTLAQWIDRADAILAQPNSPSLAGRASLLLFSIMAGLLGPTHIPSLRLRLTQLSTAAERADSDPLRIVHAAVTAYVEALGGQLHAASEILADAQHLCPDPESALFPKVHLQASQGLVHILQGNPAAASAGLDRLLAHPLFDALPHFLWLLCLSHRLFALASGGSSPALDALAERIRSRVIPKHNAYLQSYLHYSLGVAAFLDLRPQHALDHGRRAMQLGQLCASIAGEAVPALLVGQALAESGQTEEALQHFSTWLPRWQANGFALLYAAGLVEQANLLSNGGHVSEARESLTLARKMLPTREPLPAYHRSRAFGEDLELNLLPPTASIPFTGELAKPVAISTLGGLVLRFGSHVIYDREWRGDRTKALLKALVVLGGQKISAEQLCDLLWPDSEGVQARQNIKVASWRLRRLGVQDGQATLPWLVVERSHYSLVHALCTVDCHEFLHRLQKAQACGEDISLLASALDFYRGDFLPRDDSQTWVVAYREQLRQRYLHAVQTLSRRALTSNRPDFALPYLNQAVEIEPSDERTSEFRIRILLAQGYPGEALRAYHHLADALWERYSITPGHAVTQLVEPFLGNKTA